MRHAFALKSLRVIIYFFAEGQIAELCSSIGALFGCGKHWRDMLCVAENLCNASLDDAISQY